MICITETRRFAVEATPEYWRGFWDWMRKGKIHAKYIRVEMADFKIVPNISVIVRGRS